MARSTHFTKSGAMMTLALIAILIAPLYLAKGLLAPVALAVLLCFLLIPVCDFIERVGVRRVPAVLVTVTLAFALLGTVAWMAVVQMADLAPKMPEYQANIVAKLHSVNSYVSGAAAKLTKTARELGENLAPTPEPSGGKPAPMEVRVVTSPTSPLQVIGGMFGAVLEAAGSTGIVIILVVFFLIRREDLRDRFIHLIGQGQATVTIATLGDAATRVSQYLLMQLVINVTFGVLVATGLYFIGVPNAILWGILAAVLRFIPYLGAWIAAAMPIALSLAISTGWVAPMLTVGLFVALELFSNNVMEPWLYGKQTGVSPVAVLLAAIFWTWLWGGLGLLLATPLTVCLLVIGKHVPQLAFLDILLGNEPVFEPRTRVYQRLLAGDQEEASALVEGYLEHMPLVEVYDTVLIPALALAETDRYRGELDEAQHELIIQSLKDSIEVLGERQQVIQAKQATADAEEGAPAPVIGVASVPLCVVCLPVRDEADEIAGLMLAQLLVADGCVVHTVSATAETSGKVELVEQRQADVVCVSSTPPAAAMHARHLCKQLRERFPKLHLVVGLWNTKGDVTTALARIGSGPTVHLAVSLAEAQEQVRNFHQPPLEPTEQSPPIVTRVAVATA